METLKNLIEYLSIIMSVIYLTKLIKGILKIYQQSHYQLASYKKIIKLYYYADKAYILVPILVFIFFLDIWYVQLVYSTYLMVFFYVKSKQKDILKLKITPRIRRLFYSMLIFITAFATMAFYFGGFKELPAALAFIMLLSPLLVLITSLINLPVELLISLYYQKKATAKLLKLKTEVIGITGSYGKTTTKNILYSMLKTKYITLPTEKSYNTLNGVSKNINELLNFDHEFLIAEMGATRLYDIEKLVKLTKPKYAIITDVGPQHLETFKTIENILKEKMKLVDFLPKDGIAVINYNNPYIRSYQIKSECKVVKYGTNDDCDYRAYDIEPGIDGLKFKIAFLGKMVLIKTKLLGIHNVMNILAAFALSINLGVDVDDIIYEVNNLEAVKNRLSMEKIDSLTIINDAFNCNKEGFKNALEVLGYYDNLKILITPGVVEAGSEEERINYDLAAYIKKTCDFVCLVVTKSARFIQKGLDDAGYKNYQLFDKFSDAFLFVKTNYQEATVLIENDVSDYYKI